MLAKANSGEVKGWNFGKFCACIKFMKLNELITIENLSGSKSNLALSEIF